MMTHNERMQVQKTHTREIEFIRAWAMPSTRPKRPHETLSTLALRGRCVNQRLMRRTMGVSRAGSSVL
jgi:hypothetical protein